MVRGEIYFLNLSPRSGSEQKGIRPCIVVSHNSFACNPKWASVTVVPLTSSERWQVPGPTVVLFERGECGLPKPSAALAHQITTVDRSKIAGPPLGRLSDEKQQRVGESLRNYLVL